MKMTGRRPFFARRTGIARFTNDLYFFFRVLFIAYIGDEDNMEVRIIAGATVAVVVVLVVVIIMTVLFLRRYVVFHCCARDERFSDGEITCMTRHFSFSVFSRSNDECNKKQPSDCDTLEYRNGEGKDTLYFGN